ncbi:hypothetical protein EMCRGX_G001282 [Ephydatia muelleri]
MVEAAELFWRAHGPRLAYYRPAKGPVLKERFNKLEQNRTNVGLSRLVISKFATAPVGVPPSETSVPLFPPAPITKANPQNNHVNSPEHLSFPDDLNYSFNKGFLHIVEPLKAVQCESAYFEDGIYKMGYLVEE